MAADHFCLRWNNYQNNMVSELDILRTEEYLVDVTLCCEGFKYRAHKVILSACSPYFRNVFKENPCEHPVVILKDVLPEDVEALLSFVYQGVVYVSETKLTSFLQTAELLQIKGLAGAASSFDSSKLNSAENSNKRRKGAPVRIMKKDDGGEENSGSQMETEEEGGNEDDIDDSKNQNDDDDYGGEESENSGDVSGTTYNNYQIKEDEFMAQMNQTKNESMNNFIQQTMARQLSQQQQQPNQGLQNRSTPPAPTGETPSQGSFPMSNTPNHNISAELLSPGERNGRRPCPQCTKVISNKSNLLKHIRIRHSDAYNPACCILCNKIFKNKYSLRAHLNIYHKEYISPNVQQQQQQQTPTTPQTPQEQPVQQTYPVTPTTTNQQYSLQVKHEDGVNNYAAPPERPRRAMNSQDLEEALELRGRSTCWVVSLFLLTSSPGILNAMHINSYVFLAESPTNTWCKIPDLVNTNWTAEEIRQISSPDPKAQENCRMYDWNYTELSRLSFAEALNYTSSHEKPSEIGCRWGYSYVEEMPSITTEWDLVCENTPLRSTVQVAVAVGKFAGSFCFAMLADKFGRRAVFLLCCVLYMIAAPAVAITPWYYFMLAMRLAVGVAGAGVYEVGYTILSELTLTKHRTVFGCLYNISYAVGITILPLLAYFSTSWRVLQWSMSVPGFLLAINCWFIPESPRWLLNHKRYKEAYKILYGTSFPDGFTVPQEDEESKAEKKSNCNHMWYKKVLTSIMKLFQLFSSRELISRITICHLGWFTASFSYFMIALNAENFHFNKYIYIALNGIFEAPGYLLPILMMYRMGRKSSSVLLFSVTGFALLIILALPEGIPVVSVALIGRLCSAAMFAEIILYTSELFPTCVRNTAIGTSLTQAQVGTIAAPFVVDILGQKAWYLPSTVSGVLCVLTASLVLFLPETKNHPFPDTMEDIKNAPPSQKVSFKQCCMFGRQ